MVYDLDLDFKTTVSTKKINDDLLYPELLDVLSILSAHDILTAEILFGNAWGIEFGDFTPYTVKVSQITHEVLKAEFRGFGSLGNDDFLIQIKEWEVDILFSREANIVLCFNYRSPIVNDIILDWKIKKIPYSVCTKFI